LPDFVTHQRGFLSEKVVERDNAEATSDDTQKLILNIERFAVPEVLFNPSDIGVQQMGVAEAIAASINKCPKAMHGRLYNNIILVGGNSLFEGYRKRVW
uniref:Actin-like protein (inferred by orthology to a C. elegans protein) n=1 Tax=Anisakis simplex TaxID=6269 RepID=A0A0M3JIN1_ANISI